MGSAPVFELHLSRGGMHACKTHGCCLLLLTRRADIPKHSSMYASHHPVPPILLHSAHSRFGVGQWLDAALAQAFYKRMLAPPCSGRAHWGKAGQPWADPCFDGAAHYPRWCDFGCAVQVRALIPPLP